MVPRLNVILVLVVFSAIVIIINAQNSSVSVPTYKLNGEKNNNYVVRFTNVRNGQVMTLAGDQPTPGLNITATFWNNSDSQKWLLIPKGDVYLILPKRQHPQWTNFLTRTSQQGSLPSVTVVVGIDVKFGGITQQVLHGRSNQHWTFKDAKEGRVFISSPARGKCVTEKLPSMVSPSLLQKVKGIFGSKKPETNNNIEPVDLVASDCDEKEMGQLWRLEPV